MASVMAPFSSKTGEGGTADTGVCIGGRASVGVGVFVGIGIAAVV